MTHDLTRERIQRIFAAQWHGDESFPASHELTDEEVSALCDLAIAGLEHNAIVDASMKQMRGHDYMGLDTPQEQPEPAAAPTPDPVECRRMQGCCIDCGRKYGDEHGFPDLVVPAYAWMRLSPTGDEGGLLCPSCMCRRAHDAGLSEVEAIFTSGPFRKAEPAPVAELVQKLEATQDDWPASLVKLELEAAAALRQLSAERDFERRVSAELQKGQDKLLERVKELEARLEIDHAFKLNPNAPEDAPLDEALVRFELTPEQRKTFPDKIDALECDVHELEAELSAVKATNERLREGLRPFAALADSGGDHRKGMIYIFHGDTSAQITWEDTRRARSLLTETEGEK